MNLFDHIKSNSLRESFYGYLLLEIIVVFIITVVGIPLCALAFGGELFEVFIYEENYIFIIPLLLFIGLLSGYFVIQKSNRRVVVSFLYKDEYEELEIATRKISKSSIKYKTIPFGDLIIRKHIGSNFLFVDKYKGYRIIQNDKVIGYFLIDHFTWCDQKRETKYFIQSAKPFLKS